MFEIGQYVVYGNKGVCQIKDVGPIDMVGLSDDRTYYSLSQIFLKGSMIFTPVDNENSHIRPILSQKEAKALVKEIKEMKPEWVKDDKVRDRMYTEILRKADAKELSKMIIALYHRKEERIASGKKATSTDERFFHAAEDILYGELSIALGMEEDDVKNYIEECVK